MSLTRLVPSLAVIALVIGVSDSSFADEKPIWSDPPFKEFAARLDKLIKEQYPKADRVVDEKEQTLRWSYDTRKFMIHLRNLRGELQEATEQTGPDRGGIICEATIEAGQYLGMAVVPQTFDRHYFQILLMAPNRKDAGAHVFFRLSYPREIDKDFLTKIAETVDKFDSDR